MIGRLRNDKVEIYGSRSAAGFRQLVSEANRPLGLELDFTWTMKDDSDHWPFFQRQLPVLMFHTGLHSEYHRPADDAHLINFRGAERVTKLMLASIRELASDANTPAFRATSKRETPDVQRVTERAAMPPTPRLGVTWKKLSTPEGAQLLITNITPLSTAQRAGIVPSERITHCQGIAIDDDDAFRRLVLLSEQPLQLRVLNANQTARVVRVELQGVPIRIGLSWRQDDAEPNTMIVSYVVYGSAAHTAGVQIGDRVRKANGVSFQSSDEFRDLLNEAREELRLQIERRGRTTEIILPVPNMSPEIVE
jgi:S1-C subfamily serine protease